MTPEEECLKLWEDRGEALYSGTTLLGVNRSFIHFRDGYDAACLSAQEYVKERETVGAAVKRHWQDSQYALAELAKEKTRTEKALARVAELEADAERLRVAYELKVQDFSAETKRSSELHTLLIEVVTNLCDRHGGLPKSKECRYCELLNQIRAAIDAARKP